MERGRVREGCALFLWERFEAKAFAGTKIIASYYCPLNFKDSKNVWLER